MNVAFLLKSIWVFLLGVVVAIIGLYVRDNADGPVLHRGGVDIR
jgi:hypothetical protein